MLIKYVRNKERQRIGVVVAIDRNRIGWSKCNFSMGDRFDKERGKYIAQKRAEKYVYTPRYSGMQDWKYYDKSDGHLMSFFEYHHIAECIRPDFLEMVDRANHYFKD